MMVYLDYLPRERDDGRALQQWLGRQSEFPGQHPQHACS